MKNRQHLQAAIMRWLTSLRSLCHAHKVFNQKYLKEQHQQAWSVDPSSAVCPPAMRSTVQRYLNAKVLFAWNKIKEVGVFKICSLNMEMFCCCGEQVLNLAFSLAYWFTCSSFLKYLEGRVWLQALLKSMKIFPLTVHGFWILAPNPQGFSWILLPVLLE